ncbi:MAG TPA: cytochrome c oxidase subunit II [Rhizomicrobium sp.]|nr:cytochrome c oxidase subunit II [Rhizomicrobium sp.]
MTLRKNGLAKLGLATAACLALMTGAAFAMPVPWGTNMQPAVTPVMADIESFHRELLIIITLVCAVVLGLLLWIMIRYNSRANPVPSQVSHNTILEVVWTVVPVIILVVIAIPSFKLLYYEMTLPKADVTIRAIGKQWFWTYQYPGQGDWQFDSLVLTPEQAKARNEPYLLGVDNVVVVPVNRNVIVETVGSDVIHSWAVPQFGVKMDAVPGRINKTWFRATKTGTYYGQCSELCGARHAFMPIEVKVVSQADYDAWIANAKKKFARNGDATKLAAK